MIERKVTIEVTLSNFSLAFKKCENSIDLRTHTISNEFTSKISKIHIVLVSLVYFVLYSFTEANATYFKST